MQLLQTDRLGAQETVREHVAPVAADAHHARSLEIHTRTGLDIDLEPAAGFAEGADPVRAGGWLGHGIALAKRHGVELLGKSNDRAIVGTATHTVNRKCGDACMLDCN
ncbi:hypothetical protein GCM10008020_21940 [Massilia psychrophila]|nr:hypothetical protein GCM10008020_21940 [Massilia psychrophila]